MKPKQFSKGWQQKYGLQWEPLLAPIHIEMTMIQQGGRFNTVYGPRGNGLQFHFKELQKLLWPEEKKWHPWVDKELECFCNYQYVGVMGCAASGKSDDAATNVLSEWYCFPDCTTVLVSSTELSVLDLRIWGRIKAYHRAAKKRHPWLPGHLIEGRRIIVQSPRDEFKEGRDFRNGIVAVACKKGSAWVGLGSWVGIHNKRVRVVADEANLMPRAYLDSTSNLSKCEDFKLLALGNPNETTNAHGMICEPSQDLGGWEGGIDQQPGTKTWTTRFPNGICLQLPGSDSPNMKVPEDQPPPFPFLMTRQQMHDDALIWGTDDWHYTMMNEARMPRGQGSRRIITRQQCEKFGATMPAIWRDSRITKIGCLDAAYRGSGGDRCVFGELNFGYEAENDDAAAQAITNLIDRNSNYPQGRQIIALIDLVIVQIKSDPGSEPPEDQIVKFCHTECEKRGIPPNQFWYDAGMRTSLVSAFARLWSYEANSLDFGGTPSLDFVSTEIQKPCKDYYSKFVTELWYSFRLVVECRQFRQLTKESMWEFASREWKQTSSNKIEVESKEEMKVKTGRSPDFADTIVTGLYGARQAGFRISNQIPKSAARVQDRWKSAWEQKARSAWMAGQLHD